MSIIIGLTGPTGSGKSIAAAVARDMGVKVIDCDKVARQAVEKGTKGLISLVNEFGEGILNPDGTLNRKKLAEIAFSNAQNTERLNFTLLPHITELVNLQLDADKILLDAPTLFESGIDSICTDTIAVLSDKDSRIKRIIKRDGLTINEAMLRVNAGKSDEFYTERAGRILYNNGQTQEYILSATALFSKLFGGI